MKAIRARLEDKVREVVLPILINQITNEVLPASLRNDGHKIYLDYRAVRRGTGYVRPTILLEFGARSTGEPFEQHEVHCDISYALQNLKTPSTYLRVMSAKRTFWEKAIAVHTYCLRGVFRGGDPYARHWFDLDCLDVNGIPQDALEDRALAREVAKHQNHFFREKSQTGEPIDYDDAVTGALRLVPTGEALDEMKHDYKKMLDAGLLQEDAVGFGELISRIQHLQNRANSS